MSAALSAVRALLSARLISVACCVPARGDNTGTYEISWQVNGPDQRYHVRASSVSQACSIALAALKAHDANADVRALVHNGHMQPGDIHGPWYRMAIDATAR